MKIFDTHAHYDDEAFDKDRDELLTSLFSGDIGAVVNVGASLEGCIESVRLAEKYENIYAAIGVHPDDYERLERGESFMDWLKKEALTNNKVVAIGEIGLDYYWDKSFNDLQKEVFIKQIKLANELDLPLSIHDRDAHKDTFDILKEHNRGSKVVMHCFSGSVEFARECIKEGWYIALGGVVTFKNAIKMKEVAKDIPLDRLLLETDAPYLTPVPFRGKENQPAYVKYVAEEIAKLRGTTFEEIDNATTQNAERVFNL